MKVITHSKKELSSILKGVTLEVRDYHVTCGVGYGWVNTKYSSEGVNAYIQIGRPCYHLDGDSWEIVPDVNPFDYWNKLKSSREVGL